MAEGYFISFELNETTGTITNYTLITEEGETVVFDSVSIIDFQPDEISSQGSVMLISGDDIQIIIHDNPSGMIHVIANDTLATVSFTISEGIQVTEEAAGDREYVSINGTGVDAIIATDDGIISMDDVDGRTVSSIVLDDDHAMFKAIPSFTYRNRVSEQALMQALMQSRLAGEISLMVRNGSAVYNTMEYQYQFRIHVMEAQQNRIMLQVSSDDHQGRLVLMNMDRETFNLQNRELVVKLDGATVQQASSLDVLYANGQESDDAKYCVLTDGEVTQILAYIPSFSAHSLSIESMLPEVFGPMGIAAMIAAVGVLGVAAVVLVKRRH